MMDAMKLMFMMNVDVNFYENKKGSFGEHGGFKEVDVDWRDLMMLM